VISLFNRGITGPIGPKVRFCFCHIRIYNNNIFWKQKGV